jgi:hypothetical protein
MLSWFGISSNTAYFAWCAPFLLIYAFWHLMQIGRQMELEEAAKKEEQ